MNFSTHISEFEPPIPNPQLWIEKATALYEKTLTEKRGKVVFVVGELGNGKSSVMRSLNKAFSEIKPSPKVIAGSFQNGNYQPFISEVNLDIAQTTDTVGNLASMVSKLVPSHYAAFADLAGQLLQTNASHIQLIKAHSANPPKMPETPYWLLELIRESAKEKPLVCLIDDYDETQEGFGWNNFLLGLAEEIAFDSPVLFIVSVTGKARVGEHQNGETNLEFVTRELVNRNLAEWWHLRPMTREEIAEWIPLQTGLGIVAQLHGVTGGHPRWVQTLWRDWRVKEAIYFDEQRQRWEWSPDKKPELNLFKSVFEDLLIQLLETADPRRIAEAKKILGFAALEGTIFTAEALALAANRETDEIIDYLDDYFVQTDEKPNGILREIGFIDVEIAPNLTRKVFRYGFLSDWHWQVLDRFAFPTDEEKFGNSVEMIEALQIAYENDERLAARSLARLCKITDNTEKAKHYQKMADYSMHREAMREYAFALLQVDTISWDKFRCRQIAEFLLRAGDTMLYAYPYSEVLEVFERIEELADRIFDSYLKANALNYISLVQMLLGNMDIAKEKAILFKKLSIKIGDRTKISRSLSLLGTIAHSLNEYQKAIEYQEQALAISRELGNQHNESISLGNLGNAYEKLGEYQKAIEYQEQALTIARELGDRQREGVILCSLGVAYDSLSEYQKAIEYQEQSLAISRELGNQQGECAGLVNLGIAYGGLGEYQKAIEYQEQALTIARELGDRHAESASLGNMGGLYSALGEKEKARRSWKEALAIFEAIQSPNADDVRQKLVEAEGE